MFDILEDWLNKPRRMVVPGGSLFTFTEGVSWFIFKYLRYVLEYFLKYLRKGPVRLETKLDLLSSHPRIFKGLRKYLALTGSESGPVPEPLSVADF